MNIVLIGYMGTGKSAVAAEIAGLLDWTVCDVDALIIEREGRSIADIFQTDGEKYFRDIESSIIKEVSCFDQKVIATGGGAVLNIENIKNLKKNGVIVCLKASAETIYERVKDDASRPLLNVKNPLDKINAMLKARESFYANNDYVIDTSDLRVDEIARRILEYVRNN